MEWISRLEGFDTGSGFRFVEFWRSGLRRRRDFDGCPRKVSRKGSTGFVQRFYTDFVGFCTGIL